MLRQQKSAPLFRWIGKPSYSLYDGILSTAQAGRLPVCAEEERTNP
jgi:hypothetical protein